jgi:phospholipid N-methyltransferase
MEAVAQAKQKRSSVEESLRFLYFKTLKAYRTFSNSQTIECIEKNIDGSIEFLKEFKKDRSSTGAVAQSSTVLANYITDIANIKEKKTVVELGSGTGVFTKAIVKKLSGDATFFALELNKFFVAKTELNCPNAKVYHADAKDIQKYLYENDKEYCDCVISGLPWSCFDENKQIELIDSIYDSLEEGGEFLTFAYTQSSFLPQGRKFKKLLEKKFKVTIQTKTVWLNLPPAFVYVCIK